MKKSLIVLAGLLSLGLNTAFAEDVTCPELVDMRQMGSTFSTAYFDSYMSQWQLASSPFGTNDQTWQTLFTVALPTKITTANEAVHTGQDYFDHASLVTPRQSQMGNAIICDYSPIGANYSVIALNAVVYGLRHLKA